MVKDPYNQTLLTQDYTVSTDGTILSMTYTPTPNFGGSVTAGEFTFHYDACGNMVLMTNSSGDPQLSYDIDRATNGIVNTYNPGNMENIIGIGGRRGQLTIPGFGDDDMTLPIQRPGQFAVIGDNGQAGSGWIQDVDSSGSSPGITGPCGEVGMCGKSYSELLQTCINRCFALGGWDGIKDNDKLMDFSTTITTPLPYGASCDYTDDEMAHKTADFQTILDELATAKGFLNSISGIPGLFSAMIDSIMDRTIDDIKVGAGNFVLDLVKWGTGWKIAEAILAAGRALAAWAHFDYYWNDGSVGSVKSYGVYARRMNDCKEKCKEFLEDNPSGKRTGG